MAQTPIKVQENLQLQKLGISQASIAFATLTVESDKYICVCEKSNEQSQVVIVEVSNPSNVARYPIKADSARMNPVSNLIALKAGKTIQVYDATEKKKLKSYVLPEDVTYWKWISPTMIVLVTDAAVYHWTTNDDTDAPVRMFERHESLASSQIISYKTDSSMQWLALVGISPHNNRILGSVQLYSVQRKVSQPVEGHACVFCDYIYNGNSSPSIVFCFANRGPTASKLNVIEVGTPPTGNQPFPKKSVELYFPQDASADFPISVHADKVTGLIYVITKLGYVHMYEIESGVAIAVNRISTEVIFVTADQLKGDGFIGVNKLGQVLSVGVSADQIVPYLSSRKLDDIAFRLAERGGYPGAEAAFITKFNDFFNKQMYKEAATIVAKTPGQALRNPQTLARFQSAPPPPPGQPAPILSYFSTLLENCKLNKFESLELCRPVIQQGKKNLVEKWLIEDKLECSEELGDAAKTVDVNLALSIYLRGNCHQKVIQCFAETSQYQKMALYTKKVGFKADYVGILRLILRSNPDAGLQFAKSLLTQNGGNTTDIDLNAIANTFVELNLVHQCTAFLLVALKDNLPEHGDLQTKLFEMNILNAPQVADAIFSNNMLTHFDKQHIAKLCEQAGLLQRALELYTDSYDIKRLIVQTHLLSLEWLLSYFGSLSVDDTLSYLYAILEYNIRQNLHVAVQIAIKYHDQLTPTALIKMFEYFKSSEGLFLFLTAIVNYSQDSEVHFKYIQSACKTGQIKEVERICKESNCYEPEQVKNFLKEAKLTDQIPLIIVCDRFNFVNDLVLHLFKNNQLRYIEIYLQKVNPARLPEIVGSLLDVNCAEEFLRNLIYSCPMQYSLDSLVEEVAKHNRIKLLMPMLESRIASGSTESAVHTAIAIVYIDSNNHPDSFLRDNAYYDALTVGRYCEKRDPQLACAAYEKGGLDHELIRVCNANTLYKNLARYLIFKRDPQLWATVLSPQNEHRRPLIDQVVQSMLSDTFEPECVSEMVKALMAADLPNELIELLEKLVLTNSRFGSLRNLQNLLCLTAIKADSSRLMEYINRLDNYDAPNIAAVAINSKLYEEALAIYRKFEVHPQAISVLIDHLKNLDRAYEYAERCNVPEAWSLVGRAQLSNNMLKEAVDSFLKAEDTSCFLDVIECSRKSKNPECLLRYLNMVRATVRDSTVDSEYVYCLAKTSRLETLEEFLNQPHNVSVLPTGERCYDEGIYDAARIIFKYANNYPRLAATHVKLKEYQAAVECARKANNTKIWKEVCFACVSSEEYRYAQVCALNLVIHPEELDDLIRFYEEKGLFSELIVLIEASVGLERAHMGMFTELAILYAKYRPSKLREHLELFWTRLNIPKVLRTAEAFHMWSDMVFLYEKYEEYDNAILIMMGHPGSAFQDVFFRDIISKVANAELYYKSISFYVEYKPLSLNDLLMGLSTRIDHSRAITQLRSLGVLPLCRTYLTHVQKLNISVVNEALNSLYVEEEAYDELNLSINQYDNFDAVALAQSLENNPSIELRRIANSIYKNCNRWAQSIELAKRDGLHTDSVVYAAESRDPEIAQSLLEHFVELNRPDYVVSLLFTCYDILKPENVLEICWLNGMTDYCMPYLIQILREYTSAVDSMQSKAAAVQAGEDPINPGKQIYSAGPQLMLTGPAPFGATGSIPKFGSSNPFGSSSSRF